MNLFHFIQLDGARAVESQIGNKKIVTKMAEKITEEIPSYYNDGLGGTRVMRTTEEEVFDYLGRFIGRRTTNESFLTKVNDNGKVYVPGKPYILSKNVRKEVIRSDGSKVQTTTNFAFHDGYRTSRASRNGTVYFNNKGLPKK